MSDCHSWVKDIHRCFLDRNFTINPTNAPHAPALIFTWTKLLLQEGTYPVHPSFTSFTSLEKSKSIPWLFNQGHEKLSHLEHDLKLQSDLSLEAGERNKEGKERKREIKNFYLFSNRNI